MSTVVHEVHQWKCNPYFGRRLALTAVDSGVYRTVGTASDDSGEPPLEMHPQTAIAFTAVID